MTVPLLALALTGVKPAVGPPWTYARAAVLAHADCRRLPPASQEYARYLDAGFAPERLRATLKAVTAFHVNSLSPEPDLVLPALVPGSGGNLWRIDVRNYGWSRDLWGALARVYPFGTVRVVTVSRLTGRKRTRVAVAPWYGETPEGKAAIAGLVELTESNAPIVRADWFFYQTAIAAGRSEDNPGYYQFIGVKDQADFERLIGFDAKLARSFTVNLRAVASVSGVANQPRRLQRDDKIGGAYHRSFDNELATGRANPVRNLNGGFTFRAIEAYGHGANGLWKMALFNNLGVLQASAPDFIGRDKTSTSNDGRIHCYLSCVRCHKVGGLKPIDDWARRVLRAPLALQGADYDHVKRLRQQYLRHLEPFLDADRKRYEDALQELDPALTSGKVASDVADLWEWYTDTPVDLERAARECGVGKEYFTAALFRALKAQGQLDPVLSEFVRPEKEQRGVPVDQWQEAFPLAMLAIRNYVPTNVRIGDK